MSGRVMQLCVSMGTKYTIFAKEIQSGGGPATVLGLNEQQILLKHGVSMFALIVTVCNVSPNPIKPPKLQATQCPEVTPPLRPAEVPVTHIIVIQRR